MQALKIHAIAPSLGVIFAVSGLPETTKIWAKRSKSATIVSNEYTNRCCYPQNKVFRATPEQVSGWQTNATSQLNNLVIPAPLRPASKYGSGLFVGASGALGREHYGADCHGV